MSSFECSSGATAMDQSDESVLYDHFMASHIGRGKLYQKCILLELF
jgi:hypothetical protein